MQRRERRNAVKPSPLPLSLRMGEGFLLFGWVIQAGAIVDRRDPEQLPSLNKNSLPLRRLPPPPPLESPHDEFGLSIAVRNSASTAHSLHTPLCRRLLSGIVAWSRSPWSRSP